MRCLDLQPDCVARPSRLDVVAVEAMMLWPDDAGARDRWIRGAILEVGAPEIDEMPAALLRQFARDALATPRIADLRAAIGKRGVHGRIAGIVVLEATVLSCVDAEKSTLRKVRARVAERLRPAFQIEPRTMVNQDGPIYKFRPVAHLWAAHILALHHGDDAWPCGVAGLPMFLATAEAIRALAETARAAKAPVPVMEPGAAVSLPVGIAGRLPAVALSVAG